LQIQPLLSRRPSQLSGGQRQRVAIGRALVRDVDVFLFDEPLSNLDAKLRTELRVELKKLHMQLGSTMIYVTHDQIEALTLADRVAVMHGGVIQQLAAPREIYQRPVNRFVAGFVGSPAMNFISGKIQHANGSTEIACADGVRIPIEGYPFATRPEDGRPIVLGIRPEQIHLHKEFPDAIPIALRLALVEPMGADSLLWGAIGDESVSIRTGPDEDHSIGEKVDAYFQPSRTSIFDEKTGARL
jgi:multiple sugar transport system ATP-binding protein